MMVNIKITRQGMKRSRAADLPMADLLCWTSIYSE